MRADVKWTNLSRRQIARKITELGTPVGRDVVSQLLRKHRYRRRKAQKKKTMGRRHPDRNAQFENIARLKKEYLEAGWPVISVDTKKKELLGEFYRDGVIDTQETITTNDHDFGSAATGTVIPHGIYDVGWNAGYIHLNTSHDTSELACDSIAAWWEGSQPHPCETCPRRCKGSFLLFFRGCRPPLSAARSLTLWTLSNEPGLPRAKNWSLLGIGVLSGPTWDRANRVTQACHLKRVAANHDRRIGHMGDWTDHLCPCPSRLRWALR
jgi:hypothetical protein